jgi:excisionase family DNA binding protein
MDEKAQDKKTLLSIGEASEYLGVSIDTLRRWEKKEKIIALRSPGGHRYFKQKELDNLFGRKYEREKEKEARKISKPEDVEEKIITRTKIISTDKIADRESREVKIPAISPIRVISEEQEPPVVQAQPQYQPPQTASPIPPPQDSVLTPPAINTQPSLKTISSVPPTSSAKQKVVKKKSSSWIYFIIGFALLIAGFAIFVIFRSPAEVISPVP